MSSNFYESDGDRSNQASISADIYLDRIPPQPSGGIYYKAGATGAPSSVLRGDLILVIVGQDNMVTATGRLSSTGFASLAHRLIPPEDKVDEFCAQFRCVGVSKNHKTDPDGFFGPNHGSYRIGSSQVAVQIAGSCTLAYTGDRPVMVGDLLMWSPPEYNPNYRRDERPLPVLGPLHWSICNSTLRLVCLKMIQLQTAKIPLPVVSSESNILNDQGLTDQLWSNAASQRKRKILVLIMSGLVILAKRGYITILTPKVTKATAYKERLIHKVEKAMSGGISDEDVGKSTRTAHEEYKKAMNSLKENPESDGENGHFYKFNPLHLNNSNVLTRGLEGGMEIVNREDHFTIVSETIIGENTLPEAMNRDNNLEQSLVWMIRKFGLDGSTTFNRGRIENTILDILKLTSASVLPQEDVDQYTRSRYGMFGNSSKPMDNFKHHLKTFLAQEEISHMKMRDTLFKRVVGQALSSVHSAEENGGDRKIDVNLGITIY